MKSKCLLLIVFILCIAGVASLTSAPKEVQLSLWSCMPEYEPFYKAQVDLYNKSHTTQVKLNIVSTTMREAEQKIATALPSGVGPDIFDLWPLIAVKFVDGGYMKPNPAKVDKFLRSGYSADVANYFTFEKGSIGLPLNVALGEFFYNKKMFREAGLDPNKPPETFDQLLSYAKKLTKYNSDGGIDVAGVSLRLSGQSSGVAEKFRWVLYNFGGDFIVPSSGGKWHSDFDNDAGRGALKFYVDAVQKYKVDSVELVHDSDAFVTEKAAMLARESWVLGEIQSKNPSLDFGTFVMPRQNRASKYSMYSIMAIYVGPDSKNFDTAWDLTMQMVSPAGGHMMTVMNGWTSPRVDVDYSDLIAKTPQFAIFVKPQANHKYYFEPRTGTFEEIESRLADRLTSAYIDKSLLDNPANLAATVKKMANLVDQILKDNNLYGSPD